MKEIKDYPKTWENFIQDRKFLYAGDIISSQDMNFQMKLSHSSQSPEFFKQFLIEVYEKSIQNVFTKAEEVKINCVVESLEHLTNLAPQILNYEYVYISHLSVLKLNKKWGTNLLIPSKRYTGILPDFFYSKLIYRIPNYDLDLFETPLIKDTEDCLDFYFVNNPIQSLLWILQNCDYEITKEKFKMNYKHSINYPLYDCDFKVIKISIKNIEKLRDDKLNKLLNQNKNDI